MFEEPEQNRQVYFGSVHVHTDALVLIQKNNIKILDQNRKSKKKAVIFSGTITGTDIIFLIEPKRRKITFRSSD